MKNRPRFSGGRSIPDVDTLSFLTSCLEQVTLKDYFNNIHTEYCDTFRSWINSTTENSVEGLHLFSYQQFTQGSTEAIDKFYMRHRDRTVRVLAGEYAYHFLGGYGKLLEEPLTRRDALIISLPFGSSGSNYRYNELLAEATKLQVPVFVDCTWFGVCRDLHFDFSYPCIEQVVFSLSKAFPLAYLRIGCRFTKPQVYDGLNAYESDGYLNWTAQSIGLKFMNQFSPDYIPMKYYKAQQAMCNHLNVTPTNCVQIALGGDKWDHLKRLQWNRLCLSDEIIGWL